MGAGSLIQCGLEGDSPNRHFLLNETGREDFSSRPFDLYGSISFLGSLSRYGSLVLNGSLLDFGSLAWHGSFILDGSLTFHDSLTS
jgi:hypothetical protein